MPVIKKSPQLKDASNKKKALDLLRQGQGDAAELLRQNKIRALTLLSADQEKAVKLLSKNQEQTESLLKRNQERAAKLLLVKESRQSRSGLEKKKVAKLLSGEQEKAAILLKRDQGRAILLLRQNQKKAVELLSQSQEDAAELLRLGQERAAEVLKENRMIVESSYDAIIGTTLDGVITSWNGGAVRMFGYSAEEVIGKSGSTLFPPEMWEKVPALLKKVKLKEAVPDYDITGLRKDGTKFEMAISISPIVAKDGTVIGASVVERDITDRIKSEETLRQTQMIVENSHDAIIGETFEGVITSWGGGAEKVFGYSAKEIVGKSILTLTPMELTDKTLALLNKVKMGEVVADYDTVRTCKDGKKIDVAISLSPIKTIDGRIVGVSVVERDITDRKKAERKTVEGIEKFKVYTEVAPLGIFVADGTGRYLDANPVACKMSGYTKEELLNISIKDFLAPEYLGRGLENFKEMMATGHSQGEFLARKKIMKNFG